MDACEILIHRMGAHESVYTMLVMNWICFFHPCFPPLKKKEFERQEEEGRPKQLRGQADIDRVLICSSNNHNSGGEARIKPGARNSIQVSHLSGRNASTWASLHWSPGSVFTGTELRAETLSPSTPAWAVGSLTSVFTGRPNTCLCCPLDWLGAEC